MKVRPLQVRDRGRPLLRPWLTVRVRSGIGLGGPLLRHPALGRWTNSRTTRRWTKLRSCDLPRPRGAGRDEDRWRPTPTEEARFKNAGCARRTSRRRGMVCSRPRGVRPGRTSTLQLRRTRRSLGRKAGRRDRGGSGQSRTPKVRRDHSAHLIRARSHAGIATTISTAIRN